MTRLQALIMSLERRGKSQRPSVMVAHLSKPSEEPFDSATLAPPVPLVRQNHILDKPRINEAGATKPYADILAEAMGADYATEAMIAYASRTGTKRNLTFLRAAGWRLMVSARGVLRAEGMPYALDNGAWTAHMKQEPFDGDAFKKALDLLGGRADFIVLPDIVAGGLRSLESSLSWVDRVRPYGRLMLLPVQDGMEIKDVAPVLEDDMGIFIGGSTEFKERTLADWGDFGCLFDIYVHCGRVNSRRRLKACKLAKIDSFDGSGPSRFEMHARVMDAEHRQGILQ